MRRSCEIQTSDLTRLISEERMSDNHPMNDSCSDQFKMIATRDKELNDRISGSEGLIQSLKKDMNRLNGNGRRGKIDELADQISEMRTTAAEIAVRQEEQIKALRDSNNRMEDDFKEFREEMRGGLKTLDNRIWEISFKAAAMLVPVVGLATWYLQTH